MEVGHFQESCTDSIRYSKPFTVDGTLLQLIDTPGFGDTYKSDTDILQMLSEWLRDSYGEAETLAGILYMRPITEKRMGGSAARNITLFAKLCGPPFLANTVLVTTMWDAVGPDTVNALNHENELKGKFWSDLVAAGSDCVRYGRTRESGGEILARIVARRKEQKLAFVEELLEGKTLAQTSAGAMVHVQLGEDAMKLQRDLEESQMQVQQMGQLSLSLKNALDAAEKEKQAMLVKLREDCGNLEKGSWEDFVFQGASFLSDTVWGGAKVLMGKYS